MAESKVRRLFLFACYDAFSSVSDALLATLGSFARNGDVVLCADCAFSAKELNKLGPYVLHCDALSHGEYDFGSYKRCWQWAKANLDLTCYDYVYMVNDSVYGPFCPLGPFLAKMEKLGCVAFGPVFSNLPGRMHIQSWFIGLGKDVFMSEKFDRFIGGVVHLKDKRSVCKTYETGFTSLLQEMGFSIGALYRTSGKRVYNDVLRLFRSGLPFLKKASFTYHDGTKGGQIAVLLKELPMCEAELVLSDAKRLLGEKYVERLLTGNPLRLLARWVGHQLNKLGAK